MSEDDSSSEDSSSDIGETLISGREKRTTAGNRLSYLLQHLEDEDIKVDLVAEEEEDEIDYSASGDEDGDVDLESSDEDDDAGPAREGEEELEGEQELKKQERVESQKKRKAKDIMTIQPMRKRVRIADQPVKDDSAAPTPPEQRPRKKLDRVTWLQNVDDAPTRQSSRTQTIASKLVTQVRLKESRKRAVKTQEMMRIAAEKKAAEALPALTQADRMAIALRTEHENAKSLNRWEQAEEERQRIQRERLEAMRNRKLEGPVIRQWSGPVTWTWRQGPDGPLYSRFHYKATARPKVEFVEQTEATEFVKHRRGSILSTKDAANNDTAQSTQDLVMIDAPALSTGDDKSAIPDANPILQHAEEGLVAPAAATTQQESDIQSVATDANPTTFLEGIETFAAQPEADELRTTGDNTTTTSATGFDLSNLLGQTGLGPATPNSSVQDTYAPLPSMPPYHHIPHYPPAHTRYPLMSETAARSLLILESFPSLDSLAVPPTTTRKSTLQSNATGAITSIVLPDSQPEFNAAETKYLVGKRTKSVLPPAPPRAVCVITARPARFKDPKTGLAYRDIKAYKALQRVLVGGTQWSGLFGAWSGIVGEGPLGRVAKGVPEGFWSGEVRVEVKTEETKEGGPAGASVAV